MKFSEKKYYLNPICDKKRINKEPVYYLIYFSVANNDAEIKRTDIYLCTCCYRSNTQS